MQECAAGKFHFEPPSLARLRVRVPWQPHREYRALAHLARNRHIAAHQARELAGDGQPEPGAAEALRSRGIGLGELLEQFGLLLRCHTDPGVGHGKLDPVASVCHPARRSVTSPSLVNLKALLNRLSSICRSRMGSTVRVLRLSCASTSRRFLFCPASCPAVPMTSLIRGASCTVCGLSSSFPASIFDKSSTWLMRPRR